MPDLYRREAVLSLAEGGMRPAAIAAHLGVDHDRVAQDVLAARASGRSIPTFGSCPLPSVGRSCCRADVVQLAKAGLRPNDIAVQLGFPNAAVAYHLRAARRGGCLPPTSRSKPGSDKSPTRWTGAEGFPPAAEVADQVVARGLDRGVPVHEVFHLL